MVVKKLFSLQNVMKKNCLKCITLLKKLSASPKKGKPPPNKNNGPSLKQGDLVDRKVISPKKRSITHAWKLLGEKLIKY